MSRDQNHMMGIIWAENLILEIQIWQEELSAYIKSPRIYIWLYIFIIESCDPTWPETRDQP